MADGSGKEKIEGQEELDAQILAYLLKKKHTMTARALIDEAGISKEALAKALSRLPGGLSEWWGVFWDVYRAKVNISSSMNAVAYLAFQKWKASEKQDMTQHTSKSKNSNLEQDFLSLHRGITPNMVANPNMGPSTSQTEILHTREPKGIVGHPNVTATSLAPSIDLASNAVDSIMKLEPHFSGNSQDNKKDSIFVSSTVHSVFQEEMMKDYTTKIFVDTSSMLSTCINFISRNSGVKTITSSRSYYTSPCTAEHICPSYIQTDATVTKMVSLLFSSRLLGQNELSVAMWFS